MPFNLTKSQRVKKVAEVFDLTGNITPIQQKLNWSYPR